MCESESEFFFLYMGFVIPKSTDCRDEQKTISRTELDAKADDVEEDERVRMTLNARTDVVMEERERNRTNDRKNQEKKKKKKKKAEGQKKAEEDDDGLRDEEAVAEEKGRRDGDEMMMDVEKNSEEEEEEDDGDDFESESSESEFRVRERRGSAQKSQQQQQQQLGNDNNNNNNNNGNIIIHNREPETTNYKKVKKFLDDDGDVNKFVKTDSQTWVAIDRCNVLAQFLCLKHYVEFNGGTFEMLDGWELELNFRPSTGQPDSTFWGPGRAIKVRSRSDVAKALNLQIKKPPKSAPKAKEARIPQEKPLTKSQMMQTPTKQMSRKKAMENLKDVAERELSGKELDEFKNIEIEGGIRVVSVGTKTKMADNTNKVAFLKDNTGMIWANGFGAFWTYHDGKSDQGRIFRCVVQRDDSFSDETIESTFTAAADEGNKEQQQQPIIEEKKVSVNVGRAKFGISENGNVLAESDCSISCWKIFAKEVDLECGCALINPFATNEFKVRLAFQMKFADDIFNSFSSETFPFLEEKYGVDEYKAILNREYLKQTRQLAFEIEAKEFRRKAVKDRVSNATRLDRRFKQADEDDHDPEVEEEEAIKIACAKTTAEIFANIEEKAKRLKLEEELNSDEIKYEWKADRISPKDAVRIERESIKERIGLCTNIKKLVRSFTNEVERDRRVAVKELERKQKLIEKKEDEEKKRLLKIKQKRGSQWLCGSYPKQEDEEDGNMPNPVEKRVPAEAVSLYQENTGDLLELYAFARRFRKILFPGKGSSDKFMPKSSKLFVDAINEKLPNEGLKKFILGMLNPIFRDADTSTDANGAYAMSKLAGPFTDLLKEGASTSSKKSIEELKDILAETDSPMKRQIVLFDELLARSFEAISAQHSAAPFYEREAFGCLAPEAADAFVNAYCRCRFDPESFKNLSIEHQNKAGVTNTYKGLRTAPEKYACREPPSLVLQTEAEAERCVEVETFIALTAANDSKAERMKQNIIASELCEMDRNSERVFLIRDALRKISWESSVKPGCRRGDIASANGEVFPRDLCSFDAKLDSGMFAISAAINMRAVSSGNAEQNEDEEWLRLVKEECKKVAKAVSKTVHKELDPARAQKLVLSTFDSALSAAKNVGRDKFVAEIEKMDIDEKEKEENKREDDEEEEEEEEEEENKRELTRAFWDEGCQSCGMDMHEHGKGEVILCDGCPREFHKSCLDPPVAENEKLPDTWYCPICTHRQENKLEIISAKSFENVLRGTQIGIAARKGTMFTAETERALKKEPRILLAQKFKRFADKLSSNGWSSLSCEEKVDILKSLADLLLDTTEGHDDIENVEEKFKEKTKQIHEHQKNWDAYKRGENVGGGNTGKVKTSSVDETENAKITAYYEKNGEYPDSRFLWQKRFNQLEKSRRDNAVRIEPIGGDRANAAFWIFEDDEVGKKEDSNAVVFAQAAGAGGAWGCDVDAPNEDDDSLDDDDDKKSSRCLTPTTTKMRGNESLKVAEKEWMLLDAETLRENVVPDLNPQGYREGKLWVELQKRFGVKKEEEVEVKEKEEEEEKDATVWDITEEHSLITSSVDALSLLTCARECAKTLLLEIINELPEHAYEHYSEKSRNNIVDTRVNAIRALASSEGKDDKESAVLLATATLALESAMSREWFHEAWGRFARFAPVLRDATFPSIWFRLKNLKKAIKWNLAKRGGRGGTSRRDFAPESFRATSDAQNSLGPRNRGAKPNYRNADDDSSSDDDDAFRVKEGRKHTVAGEVIPAKKRRVFIEDTGL